MHTIVIYPYPISEASAHKAYTVHLACLINRPSCTDAHAFQQQQQRDRLERALSIE